MPKKENAPVVCNGCLKWDKFQEKCWVFWENKKVCTMHSDQTENYLF